MKYIVCQVQQDNESIQNIPIVFPEMLVHSMVFAQISALLQLQFFKSGKVTKVIPLSAGTIHSMSFEGDEFCYGSSESLGVKSRGREDDDLIRMADYGSGSMV